MSSIKDPNKVDLFSWCDSVSWHKQDIMNELNVKSYDIFMVQRTLGMNEAFVQAMDIASSFDFTDKFMHYQFLRNFIEKPRRKPFSKFVKVQKPSEEVMLVSDFYNINVEVAKTYMNRLSEEDFDRMRKHLYPDLGGAGKIERLKKK